MERAALSRARSTAPQKTLLLLATSGTTGRAKLVEISEMNLDYCVHSYIDKMDYGKYETGKIRYLIATPYSSVYGLLILTVCLVKSFPVVTMSGGFSLPRFYQTVQDYKVTHSEGGTMTGILMEQTGGPSRTVRRFVPALFGVGGQQDRGRRTETAGGGVSAHGVLDGVRHDGGIAAHRQTL